MRNLLIAGLLVAGLSKVVAAAPGDNETTARVSYTEDRAGTPPATEGEWVEIADPTPAKHGKVYIPVGRSAGQFTRLRIDVAEGRPRVERIRVDFENGRSRVIHVGMKLRKNSKQRSAYVDLGGAREIDRIVVISDRASRGTYTVHAQAGAGGVASR